MKNQKFTRTHLCALLGTLCLLFGITTPGVAETEWDAWWQLTPDDVIERKGEPDGSVLLYHEKYEDLPVLVEFRFNDNLLIAIKLAPSGDQSSESLLTTYRAFAGKLTELHGAPHESSRKEEQERMIWLTEHTQITLLFNQRWMLIFQPKPKE